MKNFRPLLLEDLHVESPGLEVLRLCVNQHLPEVEWVRTHRHDFAQSLLYLSGHGIQQVDGRNYPVNAGSLVCVPAGCPHAFEKQSPRTPLCLVVDFRISIRGRSQRAVSRMNAEGLSLVRQRLSWLMSLAGTQGDAAVQAREAAAVLDVAGILLGVATGSISRHKARPVSDKVRRLICAGDLRSVTIGYLVEQVGLQQDHLNRVLKRECGLTAGQMLAEARLERAKALLSDPAMQIQDAGNSVGFEDRNYFARWFRKQTGQSPRDWRRDLLGR